MLDGKGIFSWNVPAVAWGDPKNFTQVVLDGGFSRVCLKGANGNVIQTISPNSPWPDWGENVKLELVNELKTAGIKVDLWHFLFGVDPVGELSVAKKQCSTFAPDGYVWDVESSFDAKSGAVANARTITQGLRNSFPEIPQALCWWALPKSPYSGAEWHPIKVANAFLEVVDVGMPMMYWQGSTAFDAVSYLNKSLVIWRSFTEKPIIPVGRAYNGDGGYANTFSILAFADAVKSMADEQNLDGISWYSLDEVFKNPAWLDALRQTSDFTNDLTLEEKVDRLVAAHPELFP